MFTFYLESANILSPRSKFWHDMLDQLRAVLAALTVVNESEKELSGERVMVQSQEVD